MSVIVKRPSDSKLFVFTKGAESSIFPRAVKDEEKMRLCSTAVEHYANQGYRTLVFAMKELNVPESAISTTPTNVIESDFQLLGVTAMEDLLQDKVASCISDFKEAGIKVWMLTGDKGETAHQIAFSCGLYPHGDPEFRAFRFNEIPYGEKVTSEDMLEGQSKVIDEMLSTKSRFGFTISGSNLVEMLQDPVQTERLLRVFDNS